MANLYFLKYNNYYNRKVIPHKLLNWYLDYQIGSTLNVMLFNYGDGLDTQQTVNTSSWSNSLAVPDYLVVMDNNVETRWYVIEWKYQRKGQYIATLKRDILSESYDSLITSPMLIKKGTTHSQDDMIFNSEGQAYNQIKKDETLLYDETKCPWVIGYLPVDAVPDTSDKKGKEIKTYGYYSADETLTYSSKEAFYADYPYYPYEAGYEKIIRFNEEPIYNIRATARTLGTTNISFTRTGFVDYNPGTLKNAFNVDISEKNWKDWRKDNTYDVTGLYNNIHLDAFGTLGFNPGIWPPIPYQQGQRKLLPEFFPEIWNGYKDHMNELAKAVENVYNPYNPALDILNSIANKTVKIGDSTNGYKYYNVTLHADLIKEEVYAPVSVRTLMRNYLINNILYPNKVSDNNYVLSLNYVTYYYMLTEITTVNLKTTLPEVSQRPIPKNIPYSIFCAPYGELDIYKNGVKELTTIKDASLIAQAISSQAGSATVYDIQLLPYCPIRECIDEDGKFNYDPAIIIATDIYAEAPETPDLKVSKIFWCKSDSFTFNIPLVKTVENYKLENETSMYRLCSPNYNGAFEFNLAKNGGLDYIKVDCTYKPYNPYIHLAPNFKRLYGSDFNDQRGLICNGDFSLPMTTSAWADYELQNKNYQNIFDREIQSMNVNKWTNVFDRAGKPAGQGFLNLATGNAPDAVGNLIGGALTAGAGFIKDQEQINLKKDLFNYNLQNIQAIPQSLSKSSAYNILSKYVPFLEHYEASETEKAQLLSKLKWQGMTIMKVGTIQDYIYENDTYIEAMPLRLENMNIDSHEAAVIADELNMGNYWYISSEE